MQLKALANLDIWQVTRPRGEGEVVNTHVIEAVTEPQPDFEEMNRLVRGEGSELPELHLDEHTPGKISEEP